MTFTLGQLTEALAQFDDHVQVEYRGAGLDGQRPCNLDSSRGSYDELALEHYATSVPVTVRELIDRCLDADGKTLTGYKGGDYDMDSRTPVWVDNWGEWSGSGIAAVKPLHCADGTTKAVIHVSTDDDE